MFTTNIRDSDFPDALDTIFEQGECRESMSSIPEESVNFVSHFVPGKHSIEPPILAQAFFIDSSSAELKVRIHELIQRYLVSIQTHEFGGYEL
ncbi:unnamed protein product [Rodentolepis nana]|uniref:Transposase_31 domain-containing protein n=1 Tax=Rodentolepis nana TaxID=102285 RepID=A0A0R3TEW6_RODNA|nr:unnamed protein product [Rodentolepis nana]